ncbi:gp8 [Clostridium sp. CAG:813]|nr:gp8 [Clostridium sp. CAG:813]
MGRLEELRINAYLSEVARGYSNNSFIAESLFPVINSELEKVDIFEFNKEAFQVYDTERAIRANSNVISPKGFKKHTTTLTEHDLAYPIDYREEEEARKIKLQVHATNVVTQGLLLKLETQCAALAQDPTKYPATNKIALSGTSQFTHKDSDPVGVIDDAKDAISRQIGQDPNTLVMGQEVWESLKRNESLKGLIANSTNKIVTLDLLKEFFEVENIVIGKAIYSNAKDEFERVWGNNIILAYVPKLNARTEYDPAFAYTIRKKDALQIDEYEKEGNKVRYIRATDIYTPFLVGAEAGYLISNVNGTKGGNGGY